MQHSWRDDEMKFTIKGDEAQVLARQRKAVIATSEVAA